MSVSFLVKVDLIRIEFCKLGAMLLLEEELSGEEKREIAGGLSVGLEELIEEFESSG